MCGLYDIAESGTHSHKGFLHVQRARELRGQIGRDGDVGESFDLPGDGDDFCAREGEDVDVRVG
jgi:hypothetical protein